MLHLCHIYSFISPKLLPVKCFKILSILSHLSGWKYLHPALPKLLFFKYPNSSLLLFLTYLQTAWMIGRRPRRKRLSVDCSVTCWHCCRNTASLMCDRINTDYALRPQRHLRLQAPVPHCARVMRPSWTMWWHWWRHAVTKSCRMSSHFARRLLLNRVKFA